MKKFTEVCSAIVAAGAAVGVLIALYNWTKYQDISWVTAFSTLFITLLVFLVFKYVFLDPIKVKNDKLDGSLKKLNETTHSIFDAVMELQKENNPLHPLSPKAFGEWAVGNSPLELNPKGNKLARESGILKAVEDNVSILIDSIEKLKLRTAYDVQVKAFSELGSFILKTPSLEKEIKDFVFNNPTFEGKNIGFPDVIFVGSLHLRNKYLDKHPKLKENETE